GQVPSRFACALFFAGALLCASPADAAKLRVRGVTTVEARAVAQAGKVEIRGRVEDDEVRAVGEQKLRAHWGAARRPGRLGPSPSREKSKSVGACWTMRAAPSRSRSFACTGGRLVKVRPV